MLYDVWTIHFMVPLYIDSRRALSKNVTEESSNNNRPLY